jgi:hypothetical protein
MTQTKKQRWQRLCLGHWNFGFGIYLVFGAWNLVLYLLLLPFSDR